MIGAGMRLLGGLELAREPVHVADVGRRALGVAAVLVVAGAAREVGGLALAGRAGQRAVRDGVAVDVLVAAPVLHRDDAGLVEHLAAGDRLLGVREGVGHPEVHAEVEVAQHEHRRLEHLGEVERLLRELVGLERARRVEADVLAVAVRRVGRLQHVALHRARREARGGAGALDVEDDARDLGVVAEPDELVHQADAGAARRGHRAGARPAGADHHADRGELVLGLHDREGRLARVGVDPVLLHVVDQRLAEAGGRRDRVPRDHGHAGEHAADRGGRVAVDQDLPGRRVHALDAEGVALDEVRPGPGEARVDGREVERQRLRLLREGLREGRLDLGQVDAEAGGRRRPRRPC